MPTEDLLHSLAVLATNSSVCYPAKEEVINFICLVLSFKNFQLSQTWLLGIQFTWYSSEKPNYFDKNFENFVKGFAKGPWRISNGKFSGRTKKIFFSEHFKYGIKKGQWERNLKKILPIRALKAKIFSFFQIGNWTKTYFCRILKILVL